MRGDCVEAGSHLTRDVDQSTSACARFSDAAIRTSDDFEVAPVRIIPVHTAPAIVVIDLVLAQVHRIEGYREPVSQTRQ
jgi:hypothetical protein